MFMNFKILKGKKIEYHLYLSVSLGTVNNVDF